MSVSRRVARPLLAAVFIAEGLDAIRNPLPVDSASTVADIEPGAEPAAPNEPPLGAETVPLVRVNGMVQVGGGILLAIGKFPPIRAGTRVLRVRKVRRWVGAL